MPVIGDVVVIGGGVVGSACAWALTRAGASVTLLQREATPGEGWRASAGMLAAQIESGQDDPMLALGLAGRAFYRANVDALQSRTGIDIGFLHRGILQVARSDAAALAFKEKVAWQRQKSLHADWLQPEEVSQGWPWLSRTHGAFWSPEDGSLNPVGLVEALRADAVAGGARLVHDTAIGLDRSADRVEGVVGERDSYRARFVVVAGGAWAGKLSQLPRPLSVEPVRGQMASFPCPPELGSHIVFGEKCYLLRRGDELLVGSTMEHVGFDPATTQEGLNGLIEKAAVLYPPLAQLSPTRTWAGLRPGTPDGLPIIGPEPRLPGLWYAAGHGRNGILLAGMTGDLVARGIGGEDTSEELFAVRPTRFWNW
jgi:glycine oxidase